ncbi:hypothetical protein ACFDR9_001612 [Janthinobacterium sp. CG_23.3]|uniref:hypothetical protein n=1 Tax=Janthinobacterium sp. CG_23.3 TaxID=3349634 RepID=UPI0038D47B79
MKITFTTKAWLSEFSIDTPEQLRTLKGAAGLHYAPEMFGAGWTLVGTAEVTLDLLGERALVDAKIATLHEQAKSIRAEATAKCTQIEGRIQQLLAIENSAPAANENDLVQIQMEMGDDWTNIGGAMRRAVAEFKMAELAECHPGALRIVAAS